MSAESSILGAVLLDNRCFYECTDLKPQYFSLQANRQIFSAMQELDRCGKPIDLITLSNQLNSHLEEVGGLTYLDHITDGIVARPSIRQYVEIVRDAAKRTALTNSCESLLVKLADTSEPIDGLIEQQGELLLRLQAAGSAKAAHVKEVIPTILNEMATQRKHKGQIIGYSTGIHSIDYTTTGIRPGEYWVVGAAPSRGKTVLGAQIVAANASQGVPCLVFSYEMTKEQFVKRMLPAKSELNASRIRDFRSASDDDMRAVENAAGEIAQWPFWVCDPEGMKASELTALSKLYIRRHGVKLIVVDYLQIIEGSEAKKLDRVANSSNALRGLAKSEKVAVVALSQLRRPADERELPSMFHLKETGDIEAHAHTVLLIHRPKGEQQEWIGDDLIVVAKQREGLVGAEPVVLLPGSLRFEVRAI